MCSSFTISVLLSISSVLFSASDGAKPGLSTIPREEKDYTSSQAIHDKPNIMFIMVDDLGWGNVGYHNKENPEVQTPNIDYLALHGLQLNRHYVDAECSPTRTSFQSGRLPVHGNTNNNDGITDPSMGVHPDMTCIAEKLKEAGYSTHMVGKWDSGFASFRQIPVRRGYDTFYGYLGKSIDYFTKFGDGVCAANYIDIWENDRPAKPSISDVNLDEYTEYVFARKVLTKIDEMAVQQQEAEKAGEEREPFFIFYASHLPHYPTQLPEDCIDEGYYTDFTNDENMCATYNDVIFPGYYEDHTAWSCRAILQAQVAVLDSIVGQITDKLKKKDLWEQTLIVFTSDNGGSLELDETAGNNYPLRGGKASFLEGGIRATALVSGGYLPEARRGDIENGVMHISDWYVTFSEMMGIESSDHKAVAMGLPDVDGYNMWPLLAGEITESPRIELVMNKNTLIHGEYKLITGGSTKYAIWMSPIFPNASSPTQAELEEEILVCDYKKQWGCLFNVVEDPGEHNDISETLPNMVVAMHARLEELKTEFYENDFYGNDACPDGFEDIASEYVDDTVDLNSDDNEVDACGCWMAMHNYGNMAGPYQDLTDDEINFDMDEMKAVIQGIVKAKKEESQSLYNIFGIDLHSNSYYLIYSALIVATAIALVVSIRNCQATQRRSKHQAEKAKVSSYGATSI